MKNIGLVILFLALCGLACSKFGADNSTSTTTPLTVDELDALKEKKPDELTAKYNGKKVIVVGVVRKLPYTYPGAYETFGYQDVTLEGNKSGLIDCQVTEAEGAKFKDVKEGDVITVTGTFKYEKLTMDIEGCTKATAAK
jgi:hypothetical protein